MVQIPEPCKEGSAARKAGYANICEIGKERIRRAGDQIKAELGLLADSLDVGFRVLKVDDSNMSDVYYGARDLTQPLLAETVANIKTDRTALDLLFGCLVDWGLPLTLPYRSEKIDGFAVHNYGDGKLVACFDENVSETAITEIARLAPERAVFRDACFSDDAAKINLSELFKQFAPNAKIKTI